MENTFLCSSMGSPVQLFKSLDFVLFCVINLDFVITSTFQTTASLCSGLSLKEQMFPLFFSAICSVFSQILTSYTVPWLAIIRSLTLNITHEHQPLVTTSKHLSSYFLCTAHLGILFSWSITPPSSFSIDKSVCRGLLHHQEYKSMSSAHPDIPFRLALSVRCCGKFLVLQSLRQLWAISERHIECITSGLKCFPTAIYHHPQYIF